MNKLLKKYVDEYQNVHVEDKVLGKGGQGVVFRTKDPDLAIKLVTDESGDPITDKHLIQQYSKVFKRVRLLPLPENINISLPTTLLQNNAGYVMQLLSEMVPFSYFWLDGKSAESITLEDIPEWLSEISENEAKKIVHYYRTGGLRRRLNALYKCASLLARLHGNGMVYGDISPHNIFISEGLEDSIVWLIDADNIRFEMTTGGSAVYTPKYGAPELVQCKDAGRPGSDCHAFAVVAFYLLSLIHPFEGIKMNGEDEGDWASEENNGEDIEEKAYAGLLPWIDDQSDDSNSSNSGLPRSLLLTNKLTALFEGTFGPGRTSPLLRPAIYHWPEALAQAADMTVKCPNCFMDYYYDFIHHETGGHNCPYCKTQRPRILIIESYRWHGLNKPLKNPCWYYIREVPSTSELAIPRRVFDNFLMVDSDAAEILITTTDKEILIKKSDHANVNLSIADSYPQSNFQNIYSQMKIDRVTADLQFWIFADLNNPRLIKCSISGD